MPMKRKKHHKRRRRHTKEDLSLKKMHTQRLTSEALTTGQSNAETSEAPRLVLVPRWYHT